MAGIGGIESIRIDSYLFGQGGQGKVAESATLLFATTKVETKSGLTGYAGYTETSQPAKLTASIYNVGAIPLATLAAMRNSTVTVVCKNGRTFALRNAVRTGDMEVDLAAGTLPLEYESPECREI